MIERVTKITCHFVTTDEETYTRYSENSWSVVMGESEEQVYDCADIEKEYQEYIKLN